MIKLVDTKEGILDILNLFTPCLYSLKNGIVDKKQISLKFFQYAKVLSLELNGKNVGFISIYCNDRKGLTAFISMIAILSDYSGQGYGTLLLNEAIDVAKLSGMKKIRLEVRKDNVNAI